MQAGGPPATTYATRRGTVATFDDHVGAGTVVDDVDGTEWWFHCTRLADGSRLVAPGTAVTFRVTPGPTGLEATDVASSGRTA